MRKKIVIFLVVTLIGSFVTSPSWATMCEDRHLFGTYRTYAYAASPFAVGFLICRLIIGLDGEIQTGDLCSARIPEIFGEERVRLNILGGTARLTEKCQVGGTIVIDQIGPTVIEHATADHSLNVIVGVGFNELFGPFILVSVRR